MGKTIQIARLSGTDFPLVFWHPPDIHKNVLLLKIVLLPLLVAFPEQGVIDV
jgi:hypothetical protein